MSTLNEQEFFKLIGARLKLFRKEAGLTQKQLAAKAGIYPGDLSRFEQHGERIKSANTIRRICEATGHSLKELYTGELMEGEARIRRPKDPTRNPLKIIKRKWAEFTELTDTVLELMEEDAQASRTRATDEQHDCEDSQPDLNQAQA